MYKVFHSYTIVYYFYFFVEVGFLTPVALRTGYLRPGQVGYVIGGMKSTRQARIGDTMYIPSQWIHSNNSTTDLANSASLGKFI